MCICKDELTKQIKLTELSNDVIVNFRVNCFVSKNICIRMYMQTTSSLLQFDHGSSNN